MTAKAPAASCPVGWPWVCAAHSTASWKTSCGSQPTSSPKGAERITVPQPLEPGFFGSSRVPMPVVGQPAEARVAGRAARVEPFLAGEPAGVLAALVGAPLALGGRPARYARWMSVGGCQAPVSRRTWARIRPSTVNSVICVSSVTAPRRP